MKKSPLTTASGQRGVLDMPDPGFVSRLSKLFCTISRISAAICKQPSYAKAIKGVTIKSVKATGTGSADSNPVVVIGTTPEQDLYRFGYAPLTRRVTKYSPLTNKKLWAFLSLLSTVVLTSSTTQTEFPQADITNGIIHARFYLPDAAKGYYRGTRFDWSGNMPDLEYKGHTYCSQWFDNYNATTHDAIMGPVESFAPLGYDDAEEGGHFVQIGVGTVTKLKEEPYSPFRYYPVVNTGTWKITKKPASIEFTHVLADSLYPYEYKKTETLVKNKPILVITHSLKNTGQQPIVTNVYNHNLFVLDKQPTGTGSIITFPFKLLGDAEGQKGFGTGNLADIKDNSIVFNSEFPQRESVYTVLQGYGNTAKEYDIKIENHKTGAALRITSDQPLSKLVFWGNARIFSPEPYIEMSIHPGETFYWKISYEFYTCAIKP